MYLSKVFWSLLVVVVLATSPNTIYGQDSDPCDEIDHDLAQMLLDTNNTGGFVEDYDPDGNGLACDHNSPSLTDGVAGVIEAEIPADTISSSIPRGNPGRTGEQPGPGPLFMPGILWQQAIDASDSSGPIVSGEKVFVKAGDLLYAFDWWTGQHLWEYPMRGSGPDMPIVQSGIVFVASSTNGDGTISALDVDTGAEIWKFQGEDSTAPASTPLYAHGLVYYMTTEWGTRDPDTFIYALDPATGNLKWRYEANGLGRQSPSAGDGMIFFQGEDNDYIAIDGITGDKRWESDGPVNASPIFADSKVILAGKDGILTVLNSVDGSVSWSMKIYEGGRMGAYSDGAYAAVSKGMIFVTTMQGELVAIGLEDGYEMWRSTPNTRLSGYPTVSNDVVYVGARGGYIGSGASEEASILAFSTDGQELWRLALNPMPEAWDSVVGVAQPIAVVDGTIFLVGTARHHGTLVYALSS